MDCNSYIINCCNCFKHQDIYKNQKTKKKTHRNETKTLTINWEWQYETGSNPTEIASNDKIDTQNAQEIANYTFNVNVSGAQVAPQN